MKIIFLVLILVTSCTKKLQYSKEELFAIAKAGDPGMTIVLPKTMNDGVHCTDYTEGCVAGHMVKIMGLEMIAVEFMDEDQAMIGAKKIRGYYVRNWIFDDVNGEPLLESFVKDILKAKKL